MELTNLTLDSIIKYFNIVSKLGYKEYNDVYKVLILIFIEELLTSDFSYFINEKDYKTISNSINCLLGSSCLINMPLYNTYDSLLHEKKFDLITRITEDYLIRITEDNVVRIKSTPQYSSCCNDDGSTPETPETPEDNKYKKIIINMDSQALDKILVDNISYQQSMLGNPIILKIFDE